MTLVNDFLIQFLTISIKLINKKIQTGLLFNCLVQFYPFGIFDFDLDLLDNKEEFIVGVLSY